MKRNVIIFVMSIMAALALSACSQTGTMDGSVDGSIGDLPTSESRVTDAGNPDDEIETTKTYTKATTLGTVNTEYASDWDIKEQTAFDTYFSKDDELVWASFNVIKDKIVSLADYLTEVGVDVSNVTSCDDNGKFDECLTGEYDQDGSRIWEKFMLRRDLNDPEKNLIVTMTGRLIVDSNWMGTTWFIPILKINEDLIDDMKRIQELQKNPVDGRILLH